MKNRLGPLRWLSAIVIVMCMSCQKELSYMNNAEIIGEDMKRCACCGGYMITIDNVPNPAGSAYFLVAQFPDGFGIVADEKFPVDVRIDWKILPEACSGNHITITRIERR